MVDISRRKALGIMAAATVSPAIAVAGHEPKMSDRERVDHLLAELKVALRAANPNVRVKDIIVCLDEPDSPLPLLFMAQWATGTYEGDGIYSGESKYSAKERYEVTMLEQPFKGERGFSVIPVGERDRKRWMTLSETSLECFIGKKVADASLLGGTK
jgi:hypothetical protein